VISSIAAKMDDCQRRWLERFDHPHPYEESGRWYGCLCGENKGNPIHVGVRKVEFHPVEALWFERKGEG